MPTVSVIMPVYNGERFLAQAIRSIVGQTLADWELLVIDDGSVDGSRSIALGFDDPRIRVLINDGNQGLIYSRNRGLDEASGRYIAFLDADDISRPNRLEKQVRYLDGHADIGGVGSWVQPIDATGVYAPYLWKLPGNVESTRSTLLFRGQFVTSSFACRAHLIKSLRFRPETPLAEDYDLYVRMSKKARLCNLPDTLVEYRTHGNNITTQRRDALRQSLAEINRGQLKELGISPNERELAIHRHLEWMNLDATSSLLDEVETWLLRVLAANQALHVYPDSMLKRATAERWFHVCANSAALGISDALIRCYLSPLIRHLRQPLLAQVKFAAKCLLRRAPRKASCT